jgi:hypothetical protein
MWLADWRGQHADVVQMKIFAMEIETLAAPREFQDLDRLESPSESLDAIDSESVEFFLPIPLADSEAQTSTGNHIDDGSVLGKLEWMLKGREQNISADGNALGARGDRARHRHHRGQVSVVSEMMLRQPYRIETGGLASLGLRETIRI